MEDINRWLSFNHDFAIRRYCPARMEQEAALDETELSSSDATSTMPCLASSEIDDFVDSFINMDQYDYENENEDQDSSPEKHHHFVVNDEDDVDVPGSNKTASCGEYMWLDQTDDTFGYLAMEDGEMKAYENVNISMEEEEVVETSDPFGAIPEIVPSSQEATLCVDKGLDLVNMLLACAEAVGCRDNQQAEFLLSKMWNLASPSGDSLQRVSYCFAKGLKCRLSFLPHSVISNGTLTRSTSLDFPLISRENKLEAFQLLYQTTPYIAFGFMAANEAICQASQGKGSIHIIDLGMENTLQWPSLLRALASRPDGPPKVKITGLLTSIEDTPKLQTSMNLLVEEATSLGVSLEFHMIQEPTTPPSLLTHEKLKLIEGESLIVNSILQLHKYVKESRGYLKEILQSIKKLGPILLTVVEQDTNHNGPFFLGRFLESLHYYSAIFDSLEACMPRNSQQRKKIERFHYAEEICNIVAHEGPDRVERHERVDQWRRQLGRAGFQVMPLKCTSQARMMLSVYDCDGYTLSCEKGSLLLGWKGRPVMMASAWQVASV